MAHRETNRPTDPHKEDVVSPTAVEVDPTEEAQRAFDLILQSEKARKEGWEARERAILALNARGMSQQAIAETLQSQAAAAGLTSGDVEALGISKSNVAHVLRERRQVEEALQRREKQP